MNPKFNRQHGSYTAPEIKNPTAVRLFVETNTHQTITERRRFLYAEDVKEAININTLEERMVLKRWLIQQLQSSQTKEELIRVLSDSAEKDRHRLQKDFHITM